MKDKGLFLRWSLFMSLVVILSIVAASLGWIGYLRNDPTHITLVTLGVFALASAWCGRLSWRLSSGHDYREVEVSLMHGWFASSLCVSIGLIGTAVGYYLMLNHLNDGGGAGEAVKRISGHASVAIVNTIFGGICGALVEIQSHFIESTVKTASLNERLVMKKDKP